MAESDEDVEKFTFPEACTWLDERDINYEELVELKELQNLIKKTIATRKKLELETDNYSQHQTQVKHPVKNSQKLMQNILECDQKMKNELHVVYSSLVKFIGSKKVGDDIKDILKQIYGDYMSTISSYMSELVNDECPIVVAGETSAGKSSLLNLLLGTDVLPHSLLCATSTICRLHNSEEKKFVINRTEIPLKESSIQEQLRSYVSVTSEHRRDNSSARQVDIYWPIPMLQDRVTIVDTPGIGESKEMTDRLMDYLPNAVAFIYVINSSIAGGIQEDRLLHILNEQRKWEKEGKLSFFDQSCAIFVCNKWDQVEETQSEEPKVWEDTLTKLKKAWPSLSDNQVFKMSTTQAARYQKTGIGNTEKFQKLLDGIEQLVPASLEAKIKRHYVWLEKFLKKLQFSITSRINHARTSEQEKKRLQDSVMNRLYHLRLRSDKVREHLQEEARIRCEKIAESLHNHMNSEETRTHLCDWDLCDIPEISAGDMEVTRYNAEKVIVRKVQEEFKEWDSKTQQIKDLSESLTKKFCEECHLLNHDCLEIDSMLERGTSEVDIGNIIPSPTRDKDMPLFSVKEKAILFATSPLWIPLVATAAIVFMPVGIGMMIRESIVDSQERKRYEENRMEFMKKWTLEFLDKTFTEENVRKLISEVYFAEFSANIDNMCKEVIPKQIAADEKMVNNIATDMRSSQEILRQFLPLQNDMKVLMSNFLLFGLKYMANDRFSMEKVTKKQEIGRGSFSDVYLVEWNKQNGMVQAALKVLRRPLSDDLYAQLSEVDILRELKHKNIVDFYGVTYESSNEESERETTGRLMLLMEYCEDSLEHIVFNKTELQCYKFGDKTSRHDAFVYYVTMATGICAGLAHIHEKGYVHRDLKLANVLVKGHVAKVCDVGFARQEHLIHGTFVGTLTHMAPEVLEQRPYSYTADIYSMGILLWELWYCQHAYTESAFERYSSLALLDLIRSGARPIYTKKYAPLSELTELLKACWHEDPSKRLKAEKVSDTLVNIYYKYYNDECFRELQRSRERRNHESRELPGDQESVGISRNTVLYSRKGGGSQAEFSSDTGTSGSFCDDFTSFPDISSSE